MNNQFGIEKLDITVAPQTINPALLEPFCAARMAQRLIFDFGVMASLLNPAFFNAPVLDFGAGTGWISELVARMGIQVVAFDIHGDLKACLEGRAKADNRIDPLLLRYAHGDGHAMPFQDGLFGHVLCYDTLHHMHDYPKVFKEFFRVIKNGGRAVFVEPGARHSTSPETIAFVRAQKLHDPNWIERDVVLEEIDSIARDAGFSSGLKIVPMQHPLSLMTYSFNTWDKYRHGNSAERDKLADQLSRINYWERVVFFVEK